MDVIYLKLLILITTALILFQCAKATFPIATLETLDANKMCTTTFKDYTLTINGQPLETPGDRGEYGSTGETGLKGPKGDEGELGAAGPPGIVGDTGVKGVIGERGFDGRPGMKGLKGANGSAGPRGLAGSPGNCSCEDYDAESESSRVNKMFATEGKPARKSCRSAPPGVLSGIKYMGPKGSQAFQVYCNMKRKETCVRNGVNSTKNSFPKKHVLEKKPFWLSDQGINIKSIYKLTTVQLMWLQKQSSYVTQTLRYHGRDSIPYSADNISLSVQLLTWNDVVIGPYPTDETPMYYSVSPVKNECIEEEGCVSYQSFDIILQSMNVNRLPIIDMQIRDVRNERQEFYIESIEICFG